MKKLICILATMLGLLNMATLFAEEEIDFGAHLGIGAVTMDGQTWQQFSLRPDFSIGKLGIALDLTFYIDSDGNIREDDWNENQDIIDKIYYVRWAKKGDPFYVRAGSLDRVTLGYGILVKRYSNAMEYPDVRRVGLEFDFHPGDLQIEGFLANFRELDQPGLFGLRASYAFLGKLRFGATFVQDGNLFAGIKDDDGDFVPNEFDRYPDNDDVEQQERWNAVSNAVNDPALIEGLVDYPGQDWLQEDLSRYRTADEDVTAFSADISYPILPKLDVYIQWAHFQDFGNGYAPGVRFRPTNWFQMGLEYRDYQDQFIGEFFDRSYDLERVFVASTGDKILTKREKLKEAKAMYGIYADAKLNIFNFIELFTAYTTLKPKDSDESDDSNSLYAQASLNAKLIPKLVDFTAYYQQNNVDSLFHAKTPSTFHGAYLGYEIMEGLKLRLHWRTTYVDQNGDGEIHGDDEQVKTFSLETVFDVW